MRRRIMSEKKTKPKPAVKLTLLEKAYLLPIGRQPSDWMSRMDAEKRAAVEELLLAKIDGRIQATTRQLVELLTAEGIDATPNKVSRALDQLSQRR